MVAPIGFDYSWSRPTPALLRAAGAQFVCRYLSNDPGKNLSAPELKALVGAGIAVVCNWESTASRADTGGFAGGVQDAQQALAQARACGIPDDRPIYFSVDEDTTVGPNITAYFHGVGSVLPLSRIGVYGSYQVVKGCLDAKLVTWAWQTYAWSHGEWEPRAHIRQVQNGLRIGAADVDRNEAQKPDFGQYPGIHNDPGDISMADAASLHTDIQNFANLVAEQFTNTNKDIQNFANLVAAQFAKLNADVAEIKAQVGAK